LHDSSAQPIIWEAPAESKISAVVPVHSQLSQAGCTYHLKLPSQEDCMTNGKEMSKSETRASFSMIDVLGHMQYLRGTPTLHWPYGLEEEASYLSNSCSTFLRFCIARKLYFE